jgi:Holliday junction resolvasome RuvABC ATP-dependent DNA helicase subunit
MLPTFIRRSHGYMEIMLGEMPSDFPDWYEQTFGPATLQERDGPFEATSLEFALGQPDCFYEGEGTVPYRGQDAAKAELSLEIQSLYRRSLVERLKMLLVGPAGTGKTTLARIVAKRLRARRREVGLEEGSYVELLPAQVATKEKLDSFMQWVIEDPYRIVFVDEVHTLSDIEPWFPVLHDTGAPYYPMGDGRRLDVPGTVCWIAATTDPGELDRRAEGAMRRRLQPEIRLEAPTKEVLAQIVKDQGHVEELPLRDEAATAMAQRGIYPWQVKAIYEKAKKIASLDAADELTLTHTTRAFEIMALDERGLLSEDRDVIRALLNAPYELAGKKGTIRYRLSEETLCAAAGVDRGTYKKRVQPKLIRLGLLTTVGGQSLTQRAVEQYDWLVRR